MPARLSKTPDREVAGGGQVTHIIGIGIAPNMMFGVALPAYRISGTGLSLEDL